MDTRAPDPFATLPVELLSDSGVRKGANKSGGSRLGDYELLTELGRGGMGVVYKAKHVALDRIVALKMLLPSAVAGRSELDRFRSEVVATAALQHPHIVQVYEVGDNAERPFYTMQFIEGPSLSQRLRDGPIPGRDAARYVAAVSRAIHHAHQRGVLHRDLKSSNILLDQGDQPHVADFGLAKRLDSDSGMTRTGAVVGTPSYMSPEQATGVKDLTAATDVYSLGAVLYDLLTGRPPFRAESPLDTLAQVVECQPAPPRLLNPKVDRDLEAISLKCLEKNPHHRYATAELLAADLDRYLGGESISARSINLVERLASTLDRSHYDVHFQAFATMLLWFAAIAWSIEAAITAALHLNWPDWCLLTLQSSRLVLLGLLFWCLRPGNWQGHSGAERLMFSIWIGYLAACGLIGFTYRLQHGFAPELEINLYPFMAIVTGPPFFVLGSSYWGRCYAFGAAFFLLPFFMLLDLRWAPLEFGTLWAIILVMIALRLRQMSREVANAESATNS